MAGAAQLSFSDGPFVDSSPQFSSFWLIIRFPPGITTFISAAPDVPILLQANAGQRRGGRPVPRRGSMIVARGKGADS